MPGQSPSPAAQRVESARYRLLDKWRREQIRRLRRDTIEDRDTAADEWHRQRSAEAYFHLAALGLVNADTAKVLGLTRDDVELKA